MIAAPPGFVRERRGDTIVLFDETVAAAALAAGLHRPWERVGPRRPGAGTGRGPVGTAQIPNGPAVLVKQYLRGGALARINRDRYLLTARFARELTVGRAAREAGLPVGEMLGVVLVPVRFGWRAWGVARLVEGGDDLARLLASPLPRSDLEALWRASLGLLDRMHGAGLEHADLNLGNFIARRAGRQGWDVFAVDLDRARWWTRPVPGWRRRRVYRRLLRSFDKIFPAGGPIDPRKA